MLGILLKRVIVRIRFRIYSKWSIFGVVLLYLEKPKFEMPGIWDALQDSIRDSFKG